jgi:hypothetical protein
MKKKTFDDTGSSKVSPPRNSCCPDRALPPGLSIRTARAR